MSLSSRSQPNGQELPLGRLLGSFRTAGIGRDLKCKSHQCLTPTTKAASMWQFCCGQGLSLSLSLHIVGPVWTLGAINFRVCIHFSSSLSRSCSAGEDRPTWGGEHPQSPHPPSPAALLCEFCTCLMLSPRFYVSKEEEVHGSL